MIQRINLIEKEPFKFSYSKLARAGLAVVALCAAIYGARYLQLKIYKDKIAALNENIAALKEDQQQLIKTVPKRTEAGAAGTLKSIFLQNPRWADVIDDLSMRMPSSLWLTSIKGVARPTKAAPTKDAKDKKDAKDSKDAKKTESDTSNLMLAGQALRSEDVATFLSQLQESPFLSRATLATLKKADEGFAFTIECDMVSKLQ